MSAAVAAPDIHRRAASCHVREFTFGGLTGSSFLQGRVHHSSLNKWTADPSSSKNSTCFLNKGATTAKQHTRDSPAARKVEAQAEAKREKYYSNVPVFPSQLCPTSLIHWSRAPRFASVSSCTFLCSLHTHPCAPTLLTVPPAPTKNNAHT